MDRANKVANKAANTERRSERPTAIIASTKHSCRVKLNVYVQELSIFTSFVDRIKINHFQHSSSIISLYLSYTICVFE